MLTLYSIIILLVIILYRVYRMGRRRKWFIYWIRKLTYKPSPTEFPIQLVMPNERIVETIPHKIHDFSYIIPGVTQYAYDDEKSFYQHYGECYFAITIKKGGWEAFRHYEILSSGAIPYFLDIEKCPPNTLFLWPKDLLIEAQNLPGVPTPKQVKRAIRQKTTRNLNIDFKLFDQQRYVTLLSKMRDHLRNHMSTQALGEYFLERLPIKNVKKVLCLLQKKSGVLDLDHIRDMLISGLVKQPQIELQTYPACPWLFEDYPIEKARKLYGRGFTITRNLPLPMPKTPTQEELIQLLEQQYFDIIIIPVLCKKHTLMHDDTPDRFWQLLKQYPHVIAVDGNDISHSHDVPDYCSYSFCREIPHHKLALP